MFFAILLGFVTTKKSGTTFAMITLGIGELVASMALMFPTFFGGEGGITTNRVYGQPFLGITFGPQIQVYYLIAVYCFVCTALMYAFTGTPLGRMLNAVRDNPERVEFIGYNTQRVRYFAFIIAGFFAGIGGGLAAINFEIVNAADSLSAHPLGRLPAFTFLGGAMFFFGPIIGAVLLVFASVLLSELTKAWLLYFGPGVPVHGDVRARRHRQPDHDEPAGRQVRQVQAAAGALCWRCWLRGDAGASGAAALIEMIYHIQLNAALGRSSTSSASTLDTSSAASWVGAIALAAGRRSAVRAGRAAASCAVWGRARKRSKPRSSGGRPHERAHEDA